MIPAVMPSDCLGKMHPPIAARVEKPPVECTGLDPELHPNLLASTSEPAARPRSPAHRTESDQRERVFLCEWCNGPL